MTDMTIRDVRVTILRMPWANPEWIKGHALGPDRGILIVDVETAGGITGMGYLFHFRPGLKSIATFIEEVNVPRVKGKDATAVEAIWADLWTFTMTYGRGGIAVMAMSALDIALWDAVGKRATLRLHRLLGLYRSSLPIYGSGCFRGAGRDGMIEKALTYVKQGYKAIKMQVAHVHTLSEDVENVRAMREAVGPERLAHPAHIVEVLRECVNMRDLHLDRRVALLDEMQRLLDHPVAAGAAETARTVGRDF